MNEDETIIFDQIGGEAPLRALTDAFYERVAVDPILRPLYPGKDLGPAKERMALFLIQRFGGPTTYSDQRGHPRLRQRHMPFSIGEAERAAWMDAMKSSLDKVPELEKHKAALTVYFESTARFMMNREED